MQGDAEKYSLKAGIKGIPRRIKDQRKPIIIVVAWSLSVALLMIKSYWLVFANNPRLFAVASVNFDYIYTEIIEWMPRLNGVDFLLIFIFALIAGALLVDFKAILLGLIAHAVLVLTFSTAYATAYIWYVLGWGEIFSYDEGFMKWGQVVVWEAFRNMFRMAFVVLFMLAFLGVFLGAFARIRFQPSADTEPD